MVEEISCSTILNRLLDMSKKILSEHFTFILARFVVVSGKATIIAPLLGIVAANNLGNSCPLSKDK